MGYGKHEIHLGRKVKTIKKPLGSDGGQWPLRGQLHCGKLEPSSLSEKRRFMLISQVQKKKAKQKQNKPHNRCFSSLPVVLGKTQQVFNSQIMPGQVFKERLGFACSGVFKPSPSSAGGGV